MSKMDFVQLQIAAQSVLVPAEGTVEDKLRAAMEYVINHPRDVFWMSTGPDDDMKFRAAVAAVLIKGNITAEEKRLVERSLNVLQSVAAMLNGVPVNIEALDMEGVIPLMKIYREVAGMA